MKGVEESIQRIARDLEFELGVHHFPSLVGSLMGIRRIDATRVDQVDTKFGVTDVFGTMRAVNLFGRVQYLEGVHWEVLTCIAKFVMREKRSVKAFNSRCGRAFTSESTEHRLDGIVFMDIDEGNQDFWERLSPMEYEIKNNFRRCQEVSMKHGVSSVKIWKELDSMRWEVMENTAVVIPIEVLKLINDFL